MFLPIIGSFTNSKLYINLVEILVSDLVLHGKEVNQLAVVALRPEVLAVHGVHQLRRDPQLLPGLLDTPLQYIAHAQLLSDLLHFHRLALVGEAGVACDHEQVW